MFIYRKIFILFGISQIIFISSGVGYAQKEFSNWYFGNGAGIGFSSGTATALTNSNLFTEEGCASISDEAGNLLFYTNGINVWDRSHNIMPNGFGLEGGISSSQSAVILPFPGNKSKYYIFTVGEKAGPAGLSYSVVDLLAGSDKKIFTKSQNILLTPDVILAASKPDVIQKNIHLTSPVSEKLTAVKNNAADGFWVIVHQWNTNAFFAFPVKKDGVGKPVISNIGIVHKETGAGSNRESIGCLVASHDGKKLCSAICYKPDNDLELFDFDDSSGKVSNLQKIPSKGYAYGIAFSPDNSKMYVSFLQGEAGIIQYDLKGKHGTGTDNSSQWTGSDIYSSGVVITTNKIGKTVMGALQLGPDNKIYIAKTGQYLDLIHKPNEKGKACGYEEDGFFLMGKYSVYGLPSEIILVTKVEKPLVEEKKVKEEKVNDCMGRLPIIPLPKDTELFCQKELTLDAGNENAQFEWSNKEITRKIKVRESGKYSVTVTSGGCSSKATIRVEFAEKETEFIYLPEFRPSNTMLNSSFQYSINDVKSFNMKLFSSSGKLVFETTNPRKYWDGKDDKGKLLPFGEYKWLVNYLPKCGAQGLQTKEGKVKIEK